MYKRISIPLPNAMEVLAVTIFLSLLLAIFFVVMFLGSQRGARHGIEQEALLPLDDRKISPKPLAAPSTLRP